MNLIKWFYTKRYNIKAIYAEFPNSTVIFRPINRYYFVYNVNWSENDPPVTKENLEQMEQGLNDELGTGHFYRNRKSKKQGVPAVKKAMIIVNPSSGKEQAEEHIDQVKEQLEKSGYNVDIRLTGGEGDAMRFAKEGCDSKYDAVIAMGGDGTMNETVNGLAEQPYRPEMGVIPLGTVNDFARALNVPIDLIEAIGVLGGKTELADIGKINDRYFLNVLALGGIAEATGEVTSEQKTSMGSLAYIIEGLKTLTDKTPFTITVEADSGTYEEESLLFLAALTNSVAGFEKLAPDAKVADGQFHCFIVKNVALPKLLRIGANLLKGDFQKDPDVIYFTSEKLKISSSLELKANVDGDMADTVPFELKVLPGHLTIFTS
ncbi:diacylglycerol/lipid kinase family protein [Domibacillus aminovorans]|uniref:diacylglycerol/lipid kinase family protein n=1 Tax=Domibacillus aminovorans TaxID=29332 RepID=UPI000B1F4C25|nr:YegS/Rv2252/BmrU family lipid kinase [Domibacillus aminovorans]